MTALERWDDLNTVINLIKVGRNWKEAIVTLKTLRTVVISMEFMTILNTQNLLIAFQCLKECIWVGSKICIISRPHFLGEHFPNNALVKSHALRPRLDEGYEVYTKFGPRYVDHTPTICKLCYKDMIKYLYPINYQYLKRTCRKCFIDKFKLLDKKKKNIDEDQDVDGISSLFFQHHPEYTK